MKRFNEGLKDESETIRFFVASQVGIMGFNGLIGITISLASSFLFFLKYFKIK